MYSLSLNWELIVPAVDFHQLLATAKSDLKSDTFFPDMKLRLQAPSI